MLHDLQYFTGTSMAAVSEPASRIMTQSFVGGPSASGSVFGSVGGKGWILRGIICRGQFEVHLSRVPATYSRIGHRSMNKRHSTNIEEVRKDDRYRRRNMMPQPGCSVGKSATFVVETLNTHEKMKNKTAGNTSTTRVKRLTGRSRAF